MVENLDMQSIRISLVFTRSLALSQILNAGMHKCQVVFTMGNRILDFFLTPCASFTVACFIE